MVDRIIIKQLKQCKKPIFFYGASLYLKSFISNNNLEKFNIIGIIDSNFQNKEKFMSGYSIFPPEELLKYDANIIFCVQNRHIEAYETVCNKLKEMKLETQILEDPFLEFENQRFLTNKLYICSKTGKKRQVSYIPGLNIIYKGTNSTIEIGDNPIPNFSNTTITIDSNSSVKIGSSVHLISSLELALKKNSKITIGDNFSCEDVKLWISGEQNKQIKIGNDCMFSREIILRTSDFHAIFDKTSKKLINTGGDIIVGDHVWVAQRVMVLKRSVIPSGCIIGSHSLVNKKFTKENCIIAGSPAKIVKENIEWARDEIDSFL